MRERGISHREASALVWICVLPSMFLLEPSMSIARAGTSAYLVKVGSGLVFFALAWWMMVMVERYAARAGAFTLGDFLAHYLTRGVARCVLALWAGLFLVHLILLLRTVAESTAKTALGQSEISLPLVLFGGAMMLGVRYRLTALLRASYLLALFAGGLVAVLVLLLLPMMQAELLLPWQGYGHAVTAREVVFDVGSWCAGTAVFLLFPMMRAEKGARRALSGGVAVVMVIKCAVILSALSVFGSVVGAERSFLFYEMAKLVHFSQYIQRVEAIFVCAWVMVVFLAMIVLVRVIVMLLVDALAVREGRPLSMLVISLASVCALLVSDLASTVQTNEVLTYTVKPFALFIMVAAVTVGYVLRRRDEHAGRMGGDDRSVPSADDRLSQ